MSTTINQISNGFQTAYGPYVLFGRIGRMTREISAKRMIAVTSSVESRVATPRIAAFGLKENGRAATERDGDGAVAGHQIRADCEHHQERSLGGQTRIRLAGAHHQNVADDEQRRDREESGGDDPTAVRLREKRADRAQKRDERERPQPAEWHCDAFALQPDEEAEPERNREVLENHGIHAVIILRTTKVREAGLIGGRPSA